eukprot:g6113.t1
MEASNSQGRIGGRFVQQPRRPVCIERNLSIRSLQRYMPYVSELPENAQNEPLNVRQNLFATVLLEELGIVVENRREVLSLLSVVVVQDEESLDVLGVRIRVREGHGMIIYHFPLEEVATWQHQTRVLLLGTEFNRTHFAHVEHHEGDELEGSASMEDYNPHECCQEDEQEQEANQDVQLDLGVEQEQEANQDVQLDLGVEQEQEANQDVQLDLGVEQEQEANQDVQLDLEVEQEEQLGDGDSAFMGYYNPLENGEEEEQDVQLDIEVEQEQQQVDNNNGGLEVEVDGDGDVIMLVVNVGEGIDVQQAQVGHRYPLRDTRARREYREREQHRRDREGDGNERGRRVRRRFS